MCFALAYAFLIDAKHRKHAKRSVQSWTVKSTLRAWTNLQRRAEGLSVLLFHATMKATYIKSDFIFFCYEKQCLWCDFETCNKHMNYLGKSEDCCAISMT
jgi:hypothetical protein